MSFLGTDQVQGQISVYILYIIKIIVFIILEVFSLKGGKEKCVVERFTIRHRFMDKFVYVLVCYNSKRLPS